MFSIRYKALLPVALLAALLLALLLTAAQALSTAQALNRDLGERYHEIEEVRQIEVGLTRLMPPLIAWLGTGDAGSRDGVGQELDALEERLRELRAMRVVNAEEREIVDFAGRQLGAIQALARQYLDTPADDRVRLAALLHEITASHVAELGKRLHDYHDDELRQVDEQLRQAEAAQRRFRQAGIAGATLTVLLLGLAVWLNDRLLVRPILDISRSTSDIAHGQRDQGLCLDSNDELAQLSRDIDQMAGALRALAQRQEQLAHTDVLTGLMNRRAFDTALAREVDASARYARSFGVVLLDIDHFKQVNDTHGHAVGDEILRFVAATCARTLRPSDTAYRLGGEEFVFLLQEAGRDEALAVANRLREAIAAGVWQDGTRRIVVTASFGVALGPRDGRDAHTLLEAADEALYRAKAGGRNRVEAASA